MRKWFIWTSSLLLGVATLATMLSLVLGGPTHTKFGFLQGVQRSLLSVSDQRASQDTNTYLRIYSYKADFDMVQAHARRELLAKGYKETGDPYDKDRSVEFVGGNLRLLYTPFKIRHQSVQTVLIDRDTRYNPFVVTQGFMHRDPGWVTVRVLGLPPKTFWQRLRSWLPWLD